MNALVGRATVLLVVLFLALSARAEGMVYWESNLGIERTNLDRSYRSDVPDFSRFFTGGFIRSVRPSCGLAVDASHVYWADRWNNAIGRANLDGTSPDPAFIVGAAEPCGIAVDGSHIYWANSKTDSIGRARLDGSEVDQAFVDAAGNMPCGVAVDADFVYWASTLTGEVARAPRASGAPGQTIVETGEVGPCGVAVGDSHIYWGSFSESIGRADVSGSNVEPGFIGGVDRPCALAIEGSHLYWAEQSTQGAIGRAGLDGNDVDRAFIDSTSSCSVAADSLHYVPPPPPQSSFSVGKPRRNTAKGLIFIPIDVPDSGHFAVTIGAGFEWRLVKAGGPAIFGAGRKWLRVRAAPKGRQGHNIRRKLRNQGKVQFRIEMRYSEVFKNAATKEKTLTLIREKRPSRRPR